MWTWNGSKRGRVDDVEREGEESEGSREGKRRMLVKERRRSTG